MYGVSSGEAKHSTIGLTPEQAKIIESSWDCFVQELTRNLAAECRRACEREINKCLYSNKKTVPVVTELIKGVLIDNSVQYGWVIYGMFDIDSDYTYRLHEKTFRDFFAIHEGELRLKRVLSNEGNL